MRLYLWHHLRRRLSVGSTHLLAFIASQTFGAGASFSFPTARNRLFIGPLFLFSTVLSSLATADTPEKILVVGDSLSAAYGLNMEQGWVILLEKRLQKTFDGAKVINASISGETTRGGASRLPSLLLDHKPTLVIIELGGNDGLRALPIKQMRENLTTMTDTSLDAGAKVLLLAAEAPPNLGRRYTGLFRDIYDQLAVKENVETLPFIVESIFLNPSLMQSDNTHPNASAQPMLVDVVWPVLIRMIEGAQS